MKKLLSGFPASVSGLVRVEEELSWNLRSLQLSSSHKADKIQIPPLLPPPQSSGAAAAEQRALLDLICHRLARSGLYN